MMYAVLDQESGGFRYRQVRPDFDGFVGAYFPCAHSLRVSFCCVEADDIRRADDAEAVAFDGIHNGC